MFAKYIRKLRHMIIKLRIFAKEKEYEYDNHKVRYMYIPKKGAESLAVVFSAFPGKGRHAGYNLIDTLDRSVCNRLYILDDFGYKKRGAYYLGEGGNFFLPPVVSSLIQKHASGCKTKIFVGSSKGGTSALFYGLYCNADVVVIGAPQYFLGDYLTSKEEHIPIIDAIMGGHDEGKVKELNNVLPSLVKGSACKNSIKIFLHYSPRETTFPIHIKYMLEDLKQNGYQVEEDIEDYSAHGDVAKFFPDFCTRIIREIR